jgi:hypothetical protein
MSVSLSSPLLVRQIHFTFQSLALVLLRKRSDPVNVKIFFLDYSVKGKVGIERPIA